MFGFSIAEKLFTVVKNCVDNSLPTYRSGIRTAFLEQDYSEEQINKVTGDYFDEVVNNVAAILHGMSPSINTKFMLALTSPSMASLPSDATDGFIMAGTLYYIAYFAVTGKDANSRSAMELNHYQKKRMDETLAELDREISAMEAPK